jgi:hypothetical protein
MNSAIHQEYEEGFDTLGPQGAVFFKFFSLFSAKDDTVRFGRNIADDEIESKTVAEIRAYLKEQKEWIREERRSPIEMSRRMWWIVEKILEYGIFTSSDQKHVMIWLDICLDRITSP